MGKPKSTLSKRKKRFTGKKRKPVISKSDLFIKRLEKQNDKLVHDYFIKGITTET